MRKILFLYLLSVAYTVQAQENMHPSPVQDHPILIKNATIHTGNGTVIENGYIFFDKGNSTGGWQYLEAAPNDQSAGIEWGCNGTSINGTQLTIGSGENNSVLIVAGCNDANFAAKLCDNLVLSGQSDWFLPSRDELYLMYKNLHLNNQGNFTTVYWSSTEMNATQAFYFHFIDGTGTSTSQKASTANVRAVRTF